MIGDFILRFFSGGYDKLTGRYIYGRWGKGQDYEMPSAWSKQQTASTSACQCLNRNHTSES